MTKKEIIELTLRQISYNSNPPPEEIADCVGIEDYDNIVVAELNRRLSEGDMKTCEDFKSLNIKCCDTCHTFYPHYEMLLETLPDTTVAWICCTVRSALLGLKEPTEEDIRNFLEGKIRE